MTAHLHDHNGVNQHKINTHGITKLFASFDCELCGCLLEAEYVSCSSYIATREKLDQTGTVGPA